MTDRGDEIIRDLNRIANDSSLPPRVRKKALDAIQFIKDLIDDAPPMKYSDTYIDFIL